MERRFFFKTLFGTVFQTHKQELGLQYQNIQYILEFKKTPPIERALIKYTFPQLYNALK